MLRQASGPLEAGLIKPHFRARFNAEATVGFKVDLQGIGYLLTILGIVLFIVEAVSPGFFIAVPATILTLLGGFALVSPDFGIFTFWAPIVALVVGIPATVVTVLTYRRMAPPTAEPETQTATNLIGQVGQVTVAVVNNTPRGKVKLTHQSWTAITRGETIPIGARVRIVEVDGVILVVEPLE